MRWGLAWLSPADEEVHHLKGEPSSFYWEPGADGSLTWATAKEALAFARDRVRVSHVLVGICEHPMMASPYRGHG